MEHFFGSPIKKRLKYLIPFDGSPLTVTISLSDAQYRIACDAHRDSSVFGELDTSERYRVMNNATNFLPITQND